MSKAAATANVDFVQASLGVSGDILPRSKTIQRQNSRRNAGVAADDDDHHDHPEVLHEVSISRPSPLVTVPSVDALVGLQVNSPTSRSGGSGNAPHVSETRSSSISGDESHRDRDDTQYLEVELYLRAEAILATRGSKTDSFARVVLIEDTNLTEHIIGTTEIQHDTLDPKYQQSVQLRFRLDDRKHTIRCEMCDPGEIKEADTTADPKATATVLGAIEFTLQELRKMVGAGEDLLPGEPPLSVEVGVAKRDLVPLHQLQAARARRNSVVTPSLRGSASSSVTPNSRDTKAAKSAGLGGLVVVPEIISHEDGKFCWLVIGANGLRTENLSLPPSPYLKIFRMLDDGTRAPVYETGHVRSVRDCAWKTVPIPLQRLRNGLATRIIVLEVWDWGDVGGSKMIGYAKITAAQLLKGAETSFATTSIGVTGSSERELLSPGKQLAEKIELKAPTAKERRASLGATILGFGAASKPGDVCILRAEIDANEQQATRVFQSFDVEGVRREAQHLLPPRWEPLAQRYDKIQEARTVGGREESGGCCGQTCGFGCITRPFKRAKEALDASDGRRIATKYNPYLYAYLSIGSRFGSGIQALFGFARTLIELNVVLSALWIGFVAVPQLLLNEDSREVQRDVTATISSDLIDADDRPLLVYFGGYEPEYYFDDGTIQYRMDVAYFLCAVLGTFGLSLVWLVRSISSMLRAQAAHAHGSEAVGEIIGLVFNGWDMLETTQRSTTLLREHIATHLKQQLLQQSLAVNKKQARSKQQIKDLFFKRVFFMTMSFVLLVVSLATVVTVLQNQYREDIAELFGGGTIGEIAPSVIISLVNMTSPILIKLFVRLEAWTTPETELRHSIGRIFMIKMLNLILIAMQLDNTADLLGAESDPADYMLGCQENTAGKTYVQLVGTDMVLICFTTYFPKMFMYKCKMKPFGFKMTIDLPKEVMELIYRQALLWVGAFYAPMLFPIGVIAHTVVYFVKYISFRFYYKAPEKPFSRTSVTSLFLIASMASLISMVVPFGYAITQAANPFCGPLRMASCAALPYNESGACTASRYNYESLYDALMSGEQVDIFNITNYGSTNILEQITSCSASCWLATIVAALFSAPVLIVAGILLCIALNFTRAKLRSMTIELKKAEMLLQEEHQDKIKLLRFNGVAL